MLKSQWTTNNKLTFLYFISSIRLEFLILLQTWMILLVHSQVTAPKLYFLEEPRSTIARKGEPLLLNCSARYLNRLRPRIRWKLNDRYLSLDSDSRRYQLKNGSLFFNAVLHSRTSHTDNGLYSCEADISSVGTIVSNTARLQVAYISKTFDRKPENFSPQLYLGDTAVFQCRIKGQPRPTITWYRDGKIIRATSNVHIFSDGSLEISRLQFSDFATYRCEARIADRMRRSPLVSIEQNPDSAIVYKGVAPKFVVRPEDTKVIVWKDIVLHCAANGRDQDNNQPQITWLKDAVTIDTKADDRFSIVGTGSLHIRMVRMSDSGMYTCRAENMEDSVDADAELTVLVHPVVRKYPVTRNVSLKSDVKFICDIFGIPSVSITWYKNGKQLKYNNYIQLVDGKNLFIAGILKSDAGMYQCFGTNELGSTHADVRLIVSEGSQRPRKLSPVLSDMARLPSSPHNLTSPIVSSRFVTLSWEPPKYEGYDAVVGYLVYWKEAGSSRERMLNTTKLEANIQHLKPNTRYKFRVISYNEIGTSVSSSAMPITTKGEVFVPDGPRNVSAVPLSSHSIRVSWQKPSRSHGRVIKYRLYYYQSSDSKEHTMDVQGKSYVLLNLAPFTTYTFRVVAYNKNGAGTPSDEIEVRTYSARPTDPPSNVTVKGLSATSLIVRWEAPSPLSQNGLITGYKIRYRKRGTKRGVTKTTDGNRRSFTLSNLEKTAEYAVRIAALNVNGSGPVTRWVLARTLRDNLDESRVPGQPSKLLARHVDQTIDVSWAPPFDTQVMVRGYILSYGIGVPSQYEVEVDAKQLYYTIKHVQHATQYIISVAAFNKVGPGREKIEAITTEAKTAIESRTPIIPPMGLKATVISSKAVILTWTDNTLGESQLITDNRYYTVRYSSTRPRAHYRFMNASDLVAHIEDLRPFSEYIFAVKVVKGRRKSTWSLDVTNRTWESAPSTPPRDVTTNPLDATSVMLSWQPPVRPNGQITGYLIFYTMDTTLDDAAWVLDGTMGDQLSKTLHSLTPDKSYHFKVQARNRKGYSPMSKPIVYRTSHENQEVIGGGKVNQARERNSHGGWNIMRKGSRRRKGGALRSKNKQIEATTRSAQKSKDDEKKKKEISGLPTNVFITMITCVVGVTVIIVTAIVTFVLCRRRADRQERMKRKANINCKSPSKSLIPEQNPPDLWIMGDKGQGGGEGPASISASSRNSQEVKTMDGIPPGMELLDKKNHGYDLLHQEDRYVRPTPIRPKPMMIPVDSQMHPEPVTTVITFPNGHLRQNLCADYFIPGRAVYPGTPYHSQYTTPPRVHAGDISHPSSVGYPDDDGGSASFDEMPVTVGRIGYGTDRTNLHSPTSSGSNSCNEGYRSLPKHQPFTKTFIPTSPSAALTPPTGLKGPNIPKHIVKPQQPVSTVFKKPNPPISSTPTKINPSHCVGSQKITKGSKCKDVSNDGIDMQKSMSTEELSAEMANLEVLMKDLNDITQQEFHS